MTSSKPVAPAWHTAVVMIVVLGVSLMGALYKDGVLLSRLGLSGSAVRETRYVIAFSMEWILFGLIVWGTRRNGVTLSELVGGRWSSARDILRDVALSFLTLVVIGIVSACFAMLFHWRNNVNPMFKLLPHNTLELAMWVPVSLSAGFCEEVIFRGYLMRQFAAWTRSRPIGLVLQSVVFGFGHGYQGVDRMVGLVVVGAVFGVLAQWRQSLRPGIIAHALEDGIAGFVFFFARKY